MKLLEAAKVTYGDGEWTLGEDKTPRECSVTVFLAQACDPDEQSVITGAPLSSYRTGPFTVVAELEQPLRCAADDDGKWLNDALADVVERAIGKSFYHEPFEGSDTWLGGLGITVIPVTADLAVDTALARKTWFQKVAAEVPIMHVSPGSVTKLLTARIIDIDNGKLVSVWGDEVVTNDAYEDSVPVFFTGPIEIRLSSVEEATGYEVRKNQAITQVTQVVVVDMAPCAIVSVGGFASKATAGTPGTWSPTGATPPANFTELSKGNYTASPSVGWASGQSIALGDASSAYWNGIAWVVGTSPGKVTGATGGSPGTWTPGGKFAPLNLADTAGVTATPPTIWPIGQHVVTLDGSKVSWNGTAWVDGVSAGFPATGAVAGSPGTFTPTGATAPANLTALRTGSVLASPLTRWTAGQHVVLGDASKAFWNASQWTAGQG